MSWKYAQIRPLIHPLAVENVAQRRRPKLKA